MKILANLTSTHHPTKLPSGGIRSHDQTIWWTQKCGRAVTDSNSMINAIYTI
jgi:hypothetical protein